MSEPEDPSKTPELTYEGGFDAVIARMNARRDPLGFAKGEALPPLDVDFAPLKEQLVCEISPKDVPRFKDQSGHLRKSLELNPEFIGMPELCKLHGLLIAHLRKSEHPAHTMALFTRIWAEEAEFLFTHLDPRWLVSAITTFGDHGRTDTQRRVGQSMTVLFSTMKLYESERLYSGFAPQQEFKLKRLVRRKLPLNMDRYSLSSGGLDVNMLARLWVDAKEDPVIAPLAHHLLNLLNSDKGTVFRRFKTLRGREQRRHGVTASKEVPIDPESWGVVSTIKASVEQIRPFLEHHLALGAAQMTVFLDAPLPQSDLEALAHPKVKFINCDAAYWRVSGKARMNKHQLRQAFNATKAYGVAQTAWLAHIDFDEYIHSDSAITDVLQNTPKEIEALIMPPAEEIATEPDATELLFRRTYFDAGVEKSRLASLYPTFGEYLRSGFISHTTGKSIVRTGLKGVRFGVHFLKRDGKDVEAAQRVQSLNVLHRHAPDWPSFESHLEFRLTKGSYRHRGQSRLGLGDIIDILREEHGEAGPRLLFDEICTARPQVLQVLEANGMLIRTTLKSAAHEGAYV